MNISLTPELEKFINDKVASGLYQTASEVIREGLRLLKEYEELKYQRKQQLLEDIQIGLDQLARNEGIPGEKVLEELHQISKKKRQA